MTDIRTSSASRPVSRRAFVAAASLGAASIAGALAGCSGNAPEGGSATAGSADTGSTEEGGPSTGVEVRVASLSGPTSIGLVSFMDLVDSGEGTYDNTYSFNVYTAADEILPQVIQGNIDIALIPANAASVLYNRTEGGITCLDINTLGVLSVVTGDASVASFEDLAGRTVYLTGQGTTPEYSMRYLMDVAGIADSVTLEFKSEATEVVSVLAADPSAVGVRPQPFVTAALAKNDALSAPIDLTDVWNEYAGDSGSQMVTGVTVARRDFADDNPDAVEEFLIAQAASMETVKADPEAAAPLVVEAGIIESEAVAAAAIPKCHLVCMTGSEMTEALSGYLNVLYSADAESVGGALPETDFYYSVDA